MQLPKALPIDVLCVGHRTAFRVDKRSLGVESLAMTVTAALKTREYLHMTATGSLAVAVAI